MASLSLPRSGLEAVWRHYRHPWSLAIHAAAAPALLLGLWLHSGLLIAGSLATMVLNPLLFGAGVFGTAAATGGVMGRVMQGAQLWLQSASPEMIALTVWLPALMGVPLVWALWTNSLVWTLFFLGWALAYKLAFSRLALAYLAASRTPSPTEAEQCAGKPYVRFGGGEA